MTRFAGLVLLTSALAVGALGADAGDKGKPEAEPEAKKDAAPPKGEKGKKDAEDDEAKKDKELMARVAKNMEASEDRLGKKDPRDTTQQIQRDIIKDLDALIEKTKKDQQDKGGGGGGGGGGSSKGAKGSQGGGGGGGQAQGGKGGQGGEGGQAQSKGGGAKGGQGQGEGKGGGKQGKDGQGGGKAGEKKGGGGGAKAGKGKAGGQKQGGKDGKNGGGNGTAKTSNTNQKNMLADIQRDLWGKLPAARQQEMDEYAKDRFMTKYRQVIEQYYRTIAKQKQQDDD